MSKKNEKKQKTGTINPEMTLPDFLKELAGKILHPYDGETHGCLANHEIAVVISEKPGIFYGVPNWLITWSAA